MTYAIEAARYAAQVYATRESVQNYKTALELCELTSEKSPDLKATLLLELGELYKYVAMFDEAIAMYEQILGIDEGGFTETIRTYALDGIGDVHMARGDYDQALRCYKSVEDMAAARQDKKLLIEVWTDFTDLFFRLSMDAAAKGLKEEENKNRAKSQEYAERVIKQSEPMEMWENLRRGYVTLGNLSLKKRHFAEAEQSYANATKLAGQHSLSKDSLNNLGELMRRQGKYQDALKYYDAFLDWALKTGATRHEIMAYNNMGVACTAIHDYERARDLFDKAFELNKPLRKRFSAVLSLAMKGLTFELQGELPAAFELYHQAFKMALLADADAPAAVYGKLGRLMFGYDEPEPATYFLKKYLEYSPADVAEVTEMLDVCSVSDQLSDAIFHERDTSEG